VVHGVPANALDIPALAGADPKRRAAIAAKCRYDWVPAGEVVFSEGDSSESVAIVRTGLLEVVAGSPPRRVRLLGRGAIVGELGIITRQPRSATLRALRRSQVVLIDAETMRRWIDGDEGLRASLMFALACQVAQHGSQAEVSGQTPLARRSVALVNADGQSGALCQRLAESVALNVLTDIMMDPETVGFGSEPDAGELADRIGCSRADRVVLVVDNPDGLWAGACAQACDRLVAVIGAAVPSGPIAGTGEWNGFEVVGPPATTRSINGAVFVHNMVGPGGTDGIDRIARRLAGRSLGLALSGGGARVLAHIGVIGVLEEHGVIVDRVASTSMGALVAGLYAGGACAAELRQELIELDLVAKWLELGPAAPAFAGKFVAERCAPAVRDLTLLSVDLEAGTQVLHRDGDWAIAVEAAMALPGLTPPVVIDDRVHVDGAILNPLPVDVLHAEGDGPTVAIDVSGRAHRMRSWTSKWKEMDRSTLAPADVAIQAMDLASIDRHRAAVALADVLIQPQARAGTLAFDRLDELIDAGRCAAEETLLDGEVLHPMLLGASALPQSQQDMR
jgi:NTE family protein